MSKATERKAPCARCGHDADLHALDGREVEGIAMSEQSIVRVHEHREFAVISPSDTVNARRYEEIFGNEEAGTAYDLPRTAITRLTTTVVGTFKGLVNYGGPNGG